MNNLDFFDRPIAFHRCFVTITGSITAALMLSQAVYWSKRTKDKENWFYKIQSEWEDETGLTRREQDTARRCLRELGIFEEKRAGVPAKIYFKVNAERVIELLEISNKTGSKPQDIQIGGNVQSRLAETYNLDCTKAPNLIGGNVQSITENTTENTTEITTKNICATAQNVEDGFNRFWLVYPKKKAKDAAIKAWKKLNPDALLQEQVINSVEMFKAMDAQWLRNNGESIPYPATFLNGKRWTDEITKIKTNNSTFESKEKRYANGMTFMEKVNDMSDFFGLTNDA